MATTIDTENAKNIRQAMDVSIRIDTKDSTNLKLYVDDEMYAGDEYYTRYGNWATGVLPRTIWFADNANRAVSLYRHDISYLTGQNSFPAFADISGRGYDLDSENLIYMDNWELWAEGDMTAGCEYPLVSNIVADGSGIIPQLRIIVEDESTSTVTLHCYDNAGHYRAVECEVQTVTNTYRKHGSSSATTETIRYIMTPSEWWPGERIYIKRIASGKSLNIDNSNLISCTLDLRSASTDIDDSELQISEINIEAYFTDFTDEWLSTIPDDTPIVYSAGYPGDMSDPRKFYLSEQITRTGGCIKIKGEDATRFMDDYAGSIYRVYERNVVHDIAEGLKGCLTKCGITLERELSIPPASSVPADGEVRYNYNCVKEDGLRKHFGQIINLYKRHAFGMIGSTINIIDLGTLNWTRYSTSQSGKYRFVSTSIAQDIVAPSSLSEIANVVCSKYDTINGYGPASNVEGLAIHTNGNVMIYDESLATMTPAQFKEEMAGVTLQYTINEFHNGLWLDYVDAGIPTLYSDYTDLKEPDKPTWEIEDVGPVTIEYDRAPRQISANNPHVYDDGWVSDDNPSTQTVEVQTGNIYWIDTEEAIKNASADRGTVEIVTPYKLKITATSTGTCTVTIRRYLPESIPAYTPVVIVNDAPGTPVFLDDIDYGYTLTRAARSGTIIARENVGTRLLGNLANRSTYVYKFEWKGDPRMQPRDYLNIHAGDEFYMTTIESITLEHRDGGTKASITARGGHI